METRSGQHGERFHQLDGLRAVAATLVIIHHVVTASLGAGLAAKGHHTAANAVATTTASGVELFFVLSGALLLRPYVRGNRKMQAGKYLLGRVRRLWPPYLAAWLLAGAVIVLTTQHPTWWTRGAELPEFHVTSWLAQLGIVYLGDHAYNFAWWSLTIEVLFYLMVPLVVALIVRSNLSLRNMAVVYIASIAVSILATNLPGGVFPNVCWPLVRFLTYVHCFVGGVMLARFDCPSRWAWRLVMLGIPLTVLAFAFPRMNVHVGWGMIYFGIVTLALNGVSPLKNLLSQWLMVWIGERSYSLFLVHYSVMTAVCHAVSLFTTQKGAGYFVTTRAIELPLVLFTAMLTFHWIERRFAKNLVTGDCFWPTLSRPVASDESEPALVELPLSTVPS